MAQRFHKIDIQNTFFPLHSILQTRTIIGASNNRSTSANPAAGERPGIAYCHNMMPTKEGINSVGYEEIIPAITELTNNNPVVDTRVCYDNTGARVDLTWDTEGHVYALTFNATAWIKVPDTVPQTTSSNFSANDVSTGNVNGVTYICYKKKEVFTYNGLTNELENVVLDGLNMNQIKGVTASSGYLIAWTNKALAWSSTILPTDFVPSKVTGAGGGNVAGIDGNILFVVPNSLGLLIYTQSNVIAATYSGNAQFPFKFREVDDSKGGVNLDRVAYEANSASQYAYTRAGLQAVTSQRATNILPEVTDFLSGRRYEDFDEELLEIININLGDDQKLRKKIKLISSRYLVISYGLSEFTHALVLDLSLNKVGKLKITHRDVFEYLAYQEEIAKESMAFLQKDGTVLTTDFHAINTGSGVLVLGKLQHVRERMIQLLGFEVENVGLGADYTVYNRTTLDEGKDKDDLKEGYEMLKVGHTREHLFNVVAKNHSLTLIGRMQIVTAIVRYATHGRR